MKHFIGVLLIAIASINLTISQDTWADIIHTKLPSSETMFEWILELDDIGVSSDAGFRQAGSEADHEAADYLLEKISGFGISDVRLDPVEIILSTSEGVRLKLGDKKHSPIIPSTYMAFTEGTSTEGVTAELLYVGRGLDVVAFSNAAGKIVVVDLWAPGLSYDQFFSPYDVYSYDPGNSLPGAKVTQNWPVLNFRRPTFVPYSHAVNNGAIGIIAIIDFDLADTNAYFTPYDHVVRPLPGVYISKSHGQALKGLIAAGPVTANIELEASNLPAITHNVIATIPGESDEVILVTTHFDGWASNDASGTAVMLGLAKCLAQSSLKRTLVLVWAGGHFAGDEPTKQFISQNPALMDSVVVQIGIEHIAREFIQVNGKFQDTGLVAPRVFFLSGPAAFQANPTLTAITKTATVKNNLARTIGLPASGPLGAEPPGLSRWYFEHGGIPIIHLISGPAIMFTPMDTPDTVAKDQLKPVAETLVDIIEAIDTVDADLLR